MEKPKTKKKTQESVIIYIAILFTVAFLLILLSYFMQQRRNEDTISSLTQSHSQFSSQALANIEDLQNQNLSLKSENEELKDQLDERDGRIEELEGEIAEIREEWAADVKSVEDELRDRISAQSRVQRVLEGLYQARKALMEGDINTARSILTDIKADTEEHDDELTIEYRALIEEIETLEALETMEEMEND